MNDDSRLLELFERYEDGQECDRRESIVELCAACPELQLPFEERLRRMEQIEALCAACANVPFPAIAATNIPERIGRYRIEKILGRGGFGLVYLAHDDQLLRLVAIKVPHEPLVSERANAEGFLTEARTVAKLDHPNIVPVHDVGSTEQFPCYVVSKYIDGTDLATRLKQTPLPLHEAAELAATVAEALHHAHKQGVVHRDIKPGNILLDKGGKPFVGDFGLALREQDVSIGPHYAGTPAYMSPEQARAEAHRVDGRTDIYSLGVVFYEMLAGRRPFKADSPSELLDQITSVDAKPPRQIDDTIPKELERICLKALSKRASDRFTTARDFAEDLRHYLATGSVEQRSTLPGQAKRETDAAAPATPPASASPLVRIVPKGLRSFDAGEADFFLELLPGPRDRHGLPDSIRFWKTRIESTEDDRAFCVGLLYGPSGCGKSSLVKAGLLPRLSKSVAAVCVEATGGETEARLLKSLRRHVPALPADYDLIESLAALRRGRFLEPGRKVLLVLDQFEQWLHAMHNEKNTELVQALRHCDGGRLQCLVMVRDDFWLAVSRFMQALEIPVLEGDNCRLVDLFDPLHARALPFAADFFDAIVSIDSFIYYGTDDLYLNYCARFVKPGGPVGIAGSGLVREIEGSIPDHLREWWTSDLWCLHSASWWRRHWERTGIMDMDRADTMPDGWQLWLDWHRAVAPDNETEIKALEVDRGNYLGYVRLVGRRRADANLEEPIVSIPMQYTKKPLLRSEEP